MRLAGLVLLAGCGRIGFDGLGAPDGAIGDDGGGRDGDPIPLPAFGPWQTPVRQAILNSPSQEFGPTLSADGLEMIYGTRFSGNSDLYVTTRLDRVATFRTPVLLTELMTADEDAEPTLSSDGLTIVFERLMPMLTLYVATRATPTSPWQAPVPLEPQAVFAGSRGADFGPDDLSLVVANNGELFESTRATTTSPWGPLTSLGIAGLPTDGFAAVRSDGLELLWESSQVPPLAIYRATRLSRDDPFANIERVSLGAPFDTAGCGDPDLSEDGRVLTFVSNATGGMGLYDIYVTQRDPL